LIIRIIGKEKRSHLIMGRSQVFNDVKHSTRAMYV